MNDAVTTNAAATVMRMPSVRRRVRSGDMESGTLSYPPPPGQGYRIWAKALRR
jgi:hypothetical protein